MLLTKDKLPYLHDSEPYPDWICICLRTPSSNNTREDSTHGHHQMVNAKIRLFIFFADKDGEALYSQQKQDQEQTEAQIMNSLVISNVEYIFLYLSVICMSLLEKCLSRSVHFLIELFFNREGWIWLYIRSVLYFNLCILLLLLQVKNDAYSLKHTW